MSDIDGVEPIVSAAPARASGDGRQPGGGVDPAMAVKRKRVQIAIVGALLLVITLVITDQVTKSCTYSLEATPCYQVALRRLVEWVRDNPGLGVLVVIVVYAFAAVMFIPGSIITLGVGAAFASALGLAVRSLPVLTVCRTSRPRSCAACVLARSRAWRSVHLQCS